MSETPDSRNQLGAQLGTEVVARLALSQVEGDEKIFDKLDSKAGLILGFALVTVAELMGFLLLASSEGRSLKIVHPHLVETLFYLGVGLLEAGSVFAMLSLYPRPFARARITTETAPAFASGNTGALIRFMDEIHEANAPILQKKSTWTRLAAILVLAGLVCFAFIVMLLFRSLIY